MTKRIPLRCTLIVFLLLLLPLNTVSQEEKEKRDQNQNTFQKRFNWLKIRGRGFKKATLLIDQRKLDEAENVLKKLLKVEKASLRARYNLACVYALRGKTETALKLLHQAVENGLRDPSLLQTDSDLDALRDEEAFKKILQKSRVPNGYIKKADELDPAPINGRTAAVNENNSAWDNRLDLFRVFFEDPDHLQENRVRKGDSKISKSLNKWYKKGTAAGNVGDLYDNRDKGHSKLSKDRYPQLSYVKYRGPAKRSEIARSFQRYVIFNRVTMGNASEAIVEDRTWRSLARMGIMRYGNHLYRQYMQSQIYMYPEHQDHDGDDTFPVNTPYMIVSQGSSGSDQPFMKAVAATLAAFRPEVKTKLVENRALMPTLQMIFRRSNKNVSSREDYLSGKAHPSVFNDSQLNTLEMIKRAHQIHPEKRPPVAAIELRKDDLGDPGIDYFAPSQREKIITTPSAIGRVFRSTEYAKTFQLSAAPSRSLNGGSLDYHWVVLRGDEERIKIEPRNDQGSIVDVRIPWHEMRSVEGVNIRSPRVDIGLFVENDHHLSAPAFFSLYCVPREKRTYGPDNRLQSVDYNHKEYRKRYTDPKIAGHKNWRDEYIYTKDGKRVGWKRHRKNQETQTFTRHGAKVIETDSEGRAVRARSVQYDLKDKDKKYVLKQKSGETILHYTYDGPQDQLGEIKKRTSASEVE